VLASPGFRSQAGGGEWGYPVRSLSAQPPRTPERPWFAYGHWPLSGHPGDFRLPTLPNGDDLPATMFPGTVSRPGSALAWISGPRDGKTSSSGCRSRGRRVTWAVAVHGFAATSIATANTVGAVLRCSTAPMGSLHAELATVWPTRANGKLCATGDSRRRGRSAHWWEAARICSTPSQIGPRGCIGALTSVFAACTTPRRRDSVFDPSLRTGDLPCPSLAIRLAGA